MASLEQKIKSNLEVPKQQGLLLQEKKNGPKYLYHRVLSVLPTQPSAITEGWCFVVFDAYSGTQMIQL